MNTRIISIHNPNALEAALYALQEGSVIVLPTDTVYGLACLTNHKTAIKEIYRLKGRDSSKPVAVLIADIAQLQWESAGQSAPARLLAERFWPGALTLVINQNEFLPTAFSSTTTIGVRLPNHTWLRELIRKSGPIAASSANAAGGKNPRKLESVLAEYKYLIPLILDGGECQDGIPSTVVDCTRDEVKILRQGAIPEAEIFKTLSSSP